MIRRLVFALSFALVSDSLLVPMASASAPCADVAACQREADAALRALDASGPRRAGARALLRNLDAALAQGCSLGNADACRVRVQLHVVRESMLLPGGERVWNRTARREVLVRSPVFTAVESQAAIVEAFNRLRTLERARVEALDSVAGYQAFIAEFPSDPSVPRFRIRYAELGLDAAVRRSREQGDLGTLFAFCEQVALDPITEPVLFAEVQQRGTLVDVERYLRTVGSRSGTPADHLRQLSDRRRALRFADAEWRAEAEGVEPLLAVLRDAPMAPEAEHAVSVLRPLLANADALSTYEALFALHARVAPSLRGPVADGLAEVFGRLAPADRIGRALALQRIATPAGRRSVVAAVAADARASGTLGLLFETWSAAPGDAAAEAALFDAAMERGSNQEIQRYLDLVAPAPHTPAEHLERARLRLRDSAFQQATVRAEREGIGPLLDAIVADPRHPSVPATADAIVQLLPRESPTRAFDRLAAALPQVPAHVRERLADAAVELLVRMGSRDRISRFAMAADQASYAQRQRLAEIVRAEITFEPGMAGVPLLRQFARAFPGTAAAREAQREAEAREAAERSRQAQDELRARANRFRR